MMDGHARPCLTVALALGLLACDGAKGSRPDQGSATASATPRGPASGATSASPLGVAVDEKPVAIRSILAHSRGGRALQLTFSTHQLNCQDLRRRGTLLEPDETAFDITLAEQLTPAGDQAWAVTRVRLGKTSRQGNLGEATVSADDPNKTVRAKVKLALLNPAGRAGSGTPRSLQLAGEVTAVGCGLMTGFETSDARYQKDLRVSVAGARIAIHGATLSKSPKGVVLRLSSEPHTCKTGPAGADLAIALTLGEAREAVTEARLTGYQLPRRLRSVLDDEGIAARLATHSDDEGGTTVELSGAAPVGGYVLEVNGTARPRLCSPPGGG
jgi:hypothetical protein